MISPEVWAEYGPWIIATLEALIIGVLWKEIKDMRTRHEATLHAQTEKHEALAAERFKCMMEVAREATRSTEHSAQAIEALKEAIDLFKELDRIRDIRRGSASGSKKTV